MTGQSGIEVEGLETFRATSAAAARDLDGMEHAHAKAGQLLVDRARPRTPRRTGTLAAGVRYDAASGLTLLEDGEVYAGVIHGGWADHNIEPQPWLAETVADEAGAVAGVFLDELDNVLHQIHGT